MLVYQRVHSINSITISLKSWNNDLLEKQNPSFESGRCCRCFEELEQPWGHFVELVQETGAPISVLEGCSSIKKIVAICCHINWVVFPDFGNTNCISFVSILIHTDFEKKDILIIYIYHDSQIKDCEERSLL